ncbi:unnamed protein product [Gadus morhua 'NCC']
MMGQSSVLLIACWIFLASGSPSLDPLKSAAGPGSGPPPPRPEVRCRCAGYPNQTLCLWSEPSRQSLPTRYIATYRERNKPSVIQHCRLVPPGSSSFVLNSSSSPEKLWLCLLDDLKLYTDYVVNVTSVSPRGSATQLTSFMVEDIVKPDPPVELRVSKGVSRRLAVEWSPPPTWSNLEVFPLKYRLRYQRSGRSERSLRTADHPVDLGPYESTRVELPGLAAGRTYRFQVCAMELLGLGECSTWSSPVEVLTPRRR